MIFNRYQKITDIISNIKKNIVSNSIKSIALNVANLEDEFESIKKECDVNFILTTSSDGKSHRKLYPSEVYMVNSDGRFTTFETVDGNTYFYPRISLKKIMNNWSSYFVFGGRDKIINVDFINKVYTKNGKSFARLNLDSIVIEISRRSAKDIKILFESSSI